jgi:large subunit ribosomal protein L23
MMDLYGIVLRPLVTEKSTLGNEAHNEVTFEVRRDATKQEIKRAVENIFQVTVLKVCTLRRLGKVKRVGMRQGRRPDWKKAIVTLKPGDRIELFENV